MRYWSGPEIVDELEDFELDVDPESVKERRVQQLRVRAVRVHMVFFVVRILALAARARRTVAQRALRQSPRRADRAAPARAGVPAAPAPRKRRRIVVPRGNGEL